MASAALIILLVIVAILAGIAAGLMYVHLQNQEKRIAALEAADKKHRLPFRVADEIENGLAALNYIIFDEDLQRERIENAISHFQAARNERDLKK